MTGLTRGDFKNVEVVLDSTSDRGGRTFKAYIDFTGAPTVYEVNVGHMMVYAGTIFDEALFNYNENTGWIHDAA
jgi:hypothetical protein